MRYLALPFVLLIACTQKVEQPVVINWKDQKAISITVADSVGVHVMNSEYPVLGDLTGKNGHFIFTPQVPFGRGLTYLAITKSDTLLFTIPPDTTFSTPVLAATYPSCDTVPANLLKVYFRFSEPMMEYRSKQYVALLDDVTGDTISDAFLDLQPELWNDDGTVLTLWIDPGRIKKDLIPNKSLGAVLQEHHTYSLQVSKEWKSKKGVSLANNYSRKFVTSVRDTRMPGVKDWTVELRNDTVVVNCGETLDWLLLTQSVSIWSGIEKRRAKTFSEVCERQLKIIPDTPLTPGTYTLRIDALLEDNAGNNLIRLFETDVTAPDSSVNRQVHSLSFQIN